MTKEEFLLPVINRNTDKSGKTKDPDLLRRMDNPICQECHLAYQKKFPSKPFLTICRGIYDENDVHKVQETLKDVPEEDIRDILNPLHWAEKHIRCVDDNGDIKPFIARDYQQGVLSCTAERKVDRMGRGMGKTLLGVIEELHKVTTKKNYPILILCPAKAQAQKWYDDILWQCENDPELGGTLQGKRQQPYFRIEFHNGSTISIFTAGSSSGRDADVIRSQSPRRVRLEEQDLLNEGDYKAVMPLLRRYRNSEFHGSSTPTGARSTYWQMCVQFTDYREFFAPITLHPDWSIQKEDECRREARTEDVYQHEFLAEFGDLAQGVFKSHFVDASRANYRYKQCRYIPGMKYFMGVDWNGQGTGTRIRIIEYNPETKMRRIVHAEAVDGPESKTQDSLDMIRDLNRYWHCDGVYVDRGFGNVQDELLRLMGKRATNPDDKRLMEVKVIDFGAELVTNKLVPNRGNTKYLDKEEVKRRTKPFMVEGAVMVMEAGLFQFSDTDDLLDAQFRAYRVKTWSQHGFANTYEAGKEGDHDLDATMLALLGIELQHGLFFIAPTQRIAIVLHGGRIGGGPTDKTEDAMKAMENRERAATTGTVPSRQLPPKEDEGPKIILPGQFSYTVVPGRARTAAQMIPSRTAAFRNPNASRNERDTNISKMAQSDAPGGFDRTHPLGPVGKRTNKFANILPGQRYPGR